MRSTPTERRLAALRAALQRRSDTRFVDTEEFRRMVVSNRQLERADEPRARARGLYDRETGTFLFIEEERLFDQAS